MHKADTFFKDPRLAEAKKLILGALHDAQKSFTGVEPPKKELEQSTKALLEQFSDARGLPLFFPYIGSGLGKGTLVELVDGSCKYDLITGIGVHYFGHSSAGVIAKAIDASLANTVMQGNLQQNKDSLELSKLYTDLSGLDHCFLSTSGAMACENALKLCFQKNHPASRILAFERCFAGRTLGMSQVTDKAAYRDGLPPTVVVDYIPFFDSNNPAESTQRALDVLNTYLKRYPKQYAVMSMELIQGEGGIWCGSSDFFKAIIRVLKIHQIAVWVDEVQTFARTENLFAFHKFGLEGLVDIVTIGKASPACATLYTHEYSARPGLLSQTFTASTSAIQISKYMVEQALDNDFFGPTGKIAQLNKAFTQGLVALHEKYGCIHGPYGVGSMIAFTPFHGDEPTAKAFVHKLFHNGVLSFLAGANPYRVRFLLPVGAMNVGEIKPIMEIIEKTIVESLP